MNATFYPLMSILVTLATLLVVIISPFKEDANHYGTINIVFLLLLTLWNVSLVGLIKADDLSRNMVYPFIFVISAIVTLPHIYVSVLIFHWMYSHGKFGLELVRRLCAWRQGYQPLD